MEKLDVCRMCLSDDVPMGLIENKYLQAMFEKVTEIPFVREDRPVLACYICCARLHNCYKFRKNCLQSEELLQQMLNTNEYTPVKLKQIIQKKMFNITKMANISCSGLILENTHVEGQTSELHDDEVKKEISEAMTIEDNQNSETASDPTTRIIKTESENCNTNENEIDLKSENVESSEEHDDVSQWSNTEVDPLKNILLQTCDDIMDGKQAPWRVIQSQTYEDTTANNKKELTEEEDGRKLYHYNNDELDNRTCTYKPIAHETSQKQHIKISNNAKRFECDICNKHFTVKWNLATHIRCHNGDKPYTCNTCHKCFNRKSNLHTHSLIHTGDKPYNCNICNKSFKRKGHLVTHNLIHTGDKPYKCNICTKSFTKKNYLDRHYRTHTGDRPYKCNVCSKSFKQKGHLISHKRIHTGDTPYKCNDCSKGFKQSILLIKHNCINTGDKI